MEAGADDRVGNDGSAEAAGQFEAIARTRGVEHVAAHAALLAGRGEERVDSLEVVMPREDAVSGARVLRASGRPAWRGGVPPPRPAVTSSLTRAFLREISEKNVTVRPAWNSPGSARLGSSGSALVAFFTMLVALTACGRPGEDGEPTGWSAAAVSNGALATTILCEKVMARPEVLRSAWCIGHGG